jgi:hypothetical protein
MEVGQGPNWGCSAKRKKNWDAIFVYEVELIFVYSTDEYGGTR